MVERRQTPSESESLDLLAHNSTIMFEQMLSLGSRLGELSGCVNAIKDASEQAIALGKENTAHSAETRRLVEEHLRESESWKVVITKLEADLEGREFWRRVGRVARSSVTKFFMLVAFLVGLFVSLHTALPHIKDFFRGQ